MLSANTLRYRERERKKKVIFLHIYILFVFCVSLFVFIWGEIQLLQEFEIHFCWHFRCRHCLLAGSLWPGGRADFFQANADSKQCIQSLVEAEKHTQIMKNNQAKQEDPKSGGLLVKVLMGVSCLHLIWTYSLQYSNPRLTTSPVSTACARGSQHVVNNSSGREL